MCNPIAGMAAAGFIIQGGGALMKHIGQNKQHRENAQAANEAANLALQQLGERNQQEVQVAQQNILALDRQSRQQQALASVAAGEAGVAGASVDALLAMSERDAATGAITIGRNLKMTQEQLGLEGRGIQAQRRARIKSVPWASNAETGLEFASAFVGAAGSYTGKKP